MQNSKNLRSYINELEEKNEELESEVSRLTDELEQLRENISEYYVLKDPYAYNGVCWSDFY